MLRELTPLTYHEADEIVHRLVGNDALSAELAARLLLAVRDEDGPPAIPLRAGALPATLQSETRDTARSRMKVLDCLADWRSYWHTEYADDLTLTGKQADELCTVLSVQFDGSAPAPPPTRAAVEALPRYRMTVDGLKRWELVSGSSEAVWIDRNDVLALFDAPPRPVNFCSTCGKDVRGLRDVDGVHTCHNPRDAR